VPGLAITIGVAAALGAGAGVGAGFKTCSFAVEATAYVAGGGAGGAALYTTGGGAGGAIGAGFVVMNGAEGDRAFGAKSAAVAVRIGAIGGVGAVMENVFRFGFTALPRQVPAAGAGAGGGVPRQAVALAGAGEFCQVPLHVPGAVLSGTGVPCQVPTSPEPPLGAFGPEA